jgi:[ribosomal protein S5]-alanine N-acetyltransferase
VNPELTLGTARMLLDPLSVNHAPMVYEGMRDPKVYEFIPEHPPRSVEELTGRFRILSARKSPDGKEVWLNWPALLRDSGKYVGIFQATVCPGKTAEIAYIIFAEYRRQGYAMEGCRRIVDHLFANYSLTSISAKIDTANRASICMIERLGFERVLITRNADVIRGELRDEYTYEITPGQFVAPVS